MTKASLGSALMPRTHAIGLCQAEANAFNTVERTDMVDCRRRHRHRRRPCRPHLPRTGPKRKSARGVGLTKPLTRHIRSTQLIGLAPLLFNLALLLISIYSSQPRPNVLDNVAVQRPAPPRAHNRVGGRRSPCPLDLLELQPHSMGPSAGGVAR